MERQIVIIKRFPDLPWPPEYGLFRRYEINGQAWICTAIRQTNHLGTDALEVTFEHCLATFMVEPDA